MFKATNMIVSNIKEKKERKYFFSLMVSGKKKKKKMLKVYFLKEIEKKSCWYLPIPIYKKNKSKAGDRSFSCQQTFCSPNDF